MSDVSPNDQLEAIARATVELREADTDRLAQLKVELLGRKSGKLTQILRSLSTIVMFRNSRVGT